MKNSKTTHSVGSITETNRNQNPNNGESKMTRQQRRKMEREKGRIGESMNNDLDEIIVKEGVHKCLNGMTFEYKVTNKDVLRREFTSNSQLIKNLNSGLINPFEISRLLENLYGKYPEPYN